MRKPHTVFQVRRALTIIRTLTVLLIAVALVAVNLGASHVAAESITTGAALQTPDVPMLSGTFQAINDGFGDQIDPHVACDLATYTNDDFFGFLSIHYFDFATNMDHVIPGNGTNVLSDVRNGLIPFTELTISGSVVVLFDTTTQTRTVVPGFNNSHSKLGGNFVVFEDRSFSSNPNESEISVYDRSAGTVTRLTNDALLDKNPRINATGDAIVWEKCQTNGFDCDLYSAIQTAPGVFTTSALTTAPAEDRSVDTNGQIAVYISNRSGENDIYLHPLAGGPETQLSLPGDQRDPRIAGNLISFESSPPFAPGSQYDIYIYDLSRARLYRVTNTPVNETLNELSVCNGTARIVYAAPGIDFNVYSFTFQVPSSVEDDIDDLMALVQSFNLPPGTENSFITKLQDALAAIEASDIPTAYVCLSSFINECQAQSGKRLTEDQATQLINLANQIKSTLGCP